MKCFGLHKPISLSVISSDMAIIYVCIAIAIAIASHQIYKTFIVHT